MKNQIFIPVHFDELKSLINNSVKDALKEARLSEDANTPKDERLTRKGLCEHYKISPPTLHSYMKKGLPYEKMGRKTLFRRDDIDQYFKQLNPLKYNS